MEFNDNDPKPKPKFEPIRVGWYPAMIEEARDGEAKSSGKPRTEITFKIGLQKQNGEWYFRKVWGLYAWHVGEQKDLLKKIVEACGIVPKGRINPDLIVGRKLEVYLNIKIDPTGQYPDKNEVTNVRPAPGSPPPVEVADAECDAF